MQQSRCLLRKARPRQHFLTRSLSSLELRTKFFDYYKKKNHEIVKSASLIPHNDKSLLFTNAGMVPFKEYFLKPNTAPYKSAISIQKCMRAGGKHNDLDNVGYTPRHHTFFEMLGNFSFGQYNKPEAIDYAWKFLTNELKLPIDRLRVTILEGDEEGRRLWREQGLPDHKIVECGPKDNFWSMGDGEGPCGSCTEIFWNTEDKSLEDPWLEVWNLVFMEKYRHADGSLSDLPISCIDTGMGLERMLSVLQSRQNNYQIDQFKPLIDGLRNVLKANGIEASESADPSPHEKIITDHFRAICFLIGDGVVPSNIGRGYVLRRVIRRALRSANQLGINKPFMSSLYPSLLQSFPKDLYPELNSRADSICSIIQNEETSFLRTLERGISLLNNVFEQTDLQESKAVPSNIAFQLYDTYGFPLDLTMMIANERGWTICIEDWKNMNVRPQFSGYNHCNLNQKSKIVAVQAVGDGAYLAINPCPFYGLGGGQVPDKGTITLADESKWDVIDVMQPYEGGIALHIKPTNTTHTGIDFLKEGLFVTTQVDLQQRENVEVHHTATHLLNASLRHVLQCQDIVQAGSTVEAGKLRFDFTFGKPLDPDTLDKIEKRINDVILQEAKVGVNHMPIAEALSLGAVATFTEKYGDTVRVVDIPGISKELCGGTHVQDLRKLYPFKILSETSVAAGTRRIEAVAGRYCIEWYKNAYMPIPKALELLRVNETNEINGKLKKTMQDTKDLQKRLDFFTEKLASVQDQNEAITHSKLKDVDIKIYTIDSELDLNFMKKRANVLKKRQPEHAHVLINGRDIIVAFGGFQTKTETANSILKQLLKNVKGRGGGQKEMAQGRLEEPIKNQKDIVSTILPALS
ncbi:alanyl-tRNA synthetase [Sporodiniella umbellata]|nr:alanyl-tRNA synthetase [Sporodiniella umbellata]